ncbi:MAG: radical SAM protein [Chitinophagaceae bacterium]|nr:radical SAM protein [Chitinophagaceae bacterium]
MSLVQSLYHTYKRYRTLQTDRITALPIVILMPHSACNCRCVMCDIWKDNANLKQLTEEDISGLLVSLRKLETKQVLMSGGEALLNPSFFRFCELLNQHGIRVSLLSTGLTLEKNAAAIVQHVHEVIISLDGDEATHNAIRNIPDAFAKTAEGIKAIKEIDPAFRVSARSVIHRLNYKKWPAIVEAAKALRLDHISFLPADVSSHAFNREVLWSDQRQQEILPTQEELTALDMITEKLLVNYRSEIENGFIAESAAKLKKIPAYYAAFYGLNEFPFKKCNAPWVSVVVEADGMVRPCFFHAAQGNIRESRLEEILNSDESIRFRKNLDVQTDATCVKCVCYLNLSPKTKTT